MKMPLLPSAALLLGAFTATAVAEVHKVVRTLDVMSPPVPTWNLIGDFCDIDDWHPAVTNCRLSVEDGSLHRILTLADGAEFVEKRVAEEPGLSYTYRIVSSPLPLERYTATLSITRGTPSTISWSGRFTSDDPAAEGIVAGIYEAGLVAIAEMLAE